MYFFLIFSVFLQNNQFEFGGTTTMTKTNYKTPIHSETRTLHKPKLHNTQTIHDHP